ncbi:MAG: DUF1059 domain-containing protein [Sulfuricaulis sp.]|nr:DUF1059 domain-containing protein [Sulfuricaulis sp.]
MSDPSCLLLGLLLLSFPHYFLSRTRTEYPSATNCSVSIFADSEDELPEVAIQHAVSVHDHKDSPAFREQLRKTFKDERRRAA